MKKFTCLLLFILFFHSYSIAITLNANATANNGSGGIFTQLTTNANPITIQSFNTMYSSAAGTSVTVEIYSRPGAYAGFTASNVGWTLIGTLTTTSAGTATIAPLNVTSLNINLLPSTTTSFYLHAITVGGGIRYFGTGTTSMTNFSDANLALFTDVSRTGNVAFGGTQFSPRAFTGTIDYVISGPPDPCASITPISCGILTTAATTGTGVWSPGNCGFTTNGQEKVYSFTPTVTGAYTLQITAASGGFGDYFFKLASGGCGPTGWTCIGDANAPESNVIGTLTAGVTYYILFDSEVTAAASQTFRVNCLVDPCASLVATAGALTNPVCSGTTLYLRASGGNSYAWSGPAGFTSSAQNPSIPNVQPSQAGTYTVTVTGAPGCTETASVSVAVNVTPNSTASATPSVVCVGNSVQLNATGGGTYAWSGPNGFTSNQQNPTIPITTYQQAGFYFLTVTGTGGCTNTHKVEVKVFFPPIAVAAHTQSTACTGGTLQLLGSGAGAYSWTGPGGFTSTLQNPTRTNLTAAHSGVYTLVVTSPNGCTATATTTVAIVAPPVVTATVEDDNVCEGSSVFLHSNGASSYKWAGPYGYASSYQHSIITNIPIYLTGTYTVTGTGPTGCTSNASVFVNVYEGITGAASATPNPAFMGQNVQLTASGGSTYLWTGPNGFGSNEQNPLLYNVNEKAAGIYTVIISNEGGCQTTLHVTLTFVNAKSGAEVGHFDISSTKPVQGYIYPNPANTIVTLDRTENSSVLYSVMDANGRVVIKNQVSKDGQIRVETLSPGIYNVIWSEQTENGASYFGKFVRVD